MKVVKSTSTALAFFQLCLLTSARARSRVSRDTRKDTSVIEGRGTAKESRIIGGFEATEDQYSFAVSLQDDFGPFCGASLIAKDVVLTAAHCAGAPYNALVGRHDMTDKDGQEIPMKLEYPHPNYNDEADKNDIMLVFLNGPVTIDVDLIKPNSNPAVPAVGEEVTVVGWGDMDARESHETVPDSLHEVEVKVISNEECRSSSGTFEGGKEVYGDDITASNLCARADDKDSCQGDSGGPLFRTQGSEYVQVGVVSWGIGCAHDDFPGVYARVSSFYDWIQNGVCKGSQYASEAGFDCSNIPYNPSDLGTASTVDGFSSGSNMNSAFDDDRDDDFDDDRRFDDDDFDDRFDDDRRFDDDDFDDRIDDDFDDRFDDDFDKRDFDDRFDDDDFDDRFDDDHFDDRFDDDFDDRFDDRLDDRFWRHSRLEAATKGSSSGSNTSAARSMVTGTIISTISLMTISTIGLMMI